MLGKTSPQSKSLCLPLTESTSQLLEVHAIEVAKLDFHYGPFFWGFRHGPIKPDCVIATVRSDYE